MTETSRDSMKEVQHIIHLATWEAQRLKHRYVGTEHILLALIADEDGIVARALSNSGLRPNKLRMAVDFIIGRGDRAPEEKARLTRRARRVIELAQEEARKLNYSYCGSEHLLLGILRENEGVAAGILDSLLGAGLEKIKREIVIRCGKCFRCGGKTARALVDYPLAPKGKVIILRSVPAEMCSRCGELLQAQLDPKLEERIRHLVDSDAVPHKIANVPVYELADIC